MKTTIQILCAIVSIPVLLTLATFTVLGWIGGLIYIGYLMGFDAAKETPDWFIAKLK